jgi:hypothetical protein
MRRRRVISSRARTLAVERPVQRQTLRASFGGLRTWLHLQPQNPQQRQGTRGSVDNRVANGEPCFRRAAPAQAGSHKRGRRCLAVEIVALRPAITANTAKRHSSIHSTHRRGPGRNRPATPDSRSGDGRRRATQCSCQPATAPGRKTDLIRVALTDTRRVSSGRKEPRTKEGHDMGLTAGSGRDWRPDGHSTKPKAPAGPSNIEAAPARS